MVPQHTKIHTEPIPLRQREIPHLEFSIFNFWRERSGHQMALSDAVFDHQVVLGAHAHNLLLFIVILEHSSQLTWLLGPINRGTAVGWLGQSSQLPEFGAQLFVGIFLLGR